MTSLRVRILKALAAALCAAAVSALPVFLSVPPRYTVVQWLRVRQGQPFSEPSGDERLDPAAYQEQITGPLVLGKVVERPDIAQLPWIKQHGGGPDAVRWLKDRLDVPDSEGGPAVRIVMSGDDSDQLRRIVNAVTDVYLAEVVAEDRNRLEQRLKEAQQTHREKSEEHAAKFVQTHQFEAQIGMRGPALDEAGKKLLAARIADLETQAGPLAAAVAAKKKEIDRFKTTHNAGNDDRVLVSEETIRKMAAADESVAAAARSLKALKAKFAQRARFVRDPEKDEAMQQLAQDIRAATGRLRTMWIEKQRQVARGIATGEIRSEQQQALDGLLAELHRLQGEKEANQRLRLRLAAQISEAADSAARLAESRRELENLRQTVADLDSEITALELELASRDKVVREGGAERPTTPDTRRRDRLTALAAAAGFLIVFCGAYLLAGRGPKPQPAPTGYPAGVSPVPRKQPPEETTPPASQPTENTRQPRQQTQTRHET